MAAVFYGWRVVGAGFVAQACAMGTTSYAYGLFIKPVAEEFGSSRTSVMLGMTIMWLVVGVLSPFLGRELDRRSTRTAMLLGGGAMLVGFASMAAAPSLWLLGVLLALLVAPGSAAMGPLAASTAVANWFVRRRGRALGVSTVGTSAGGLVVPPLAAWGMGAFGWRGALLSFALLIAGLALPLLSLWMVGRPEERGLAPDGDDPSALAHQRPGEASIWTFGGLLLDRNFWGIGLAAGIPLAVVGSLIANLPAFASDLGVADGPVAFLVSLLSLAAIVGKLAFGALADRVDKRALMLVAMALVVVYLAQLLSTPGYAELALGTAVVGFALGGFLPIWGALIGECFGRESYGLVMGSMSPVMLPFNLLAPLLGSWSFDTTGSYVLGFQLCMAAVIAAAGTMALVRAPAVEAAPAA